MSAPFLSKTLKKDNPKWYVPIKKQKDKLQNKKKELILQKKEKLKKEKELLRRLHVKDGSRVIEGAEAFLFVWKKIPKYNFLYKFFKLPIIFQVFKFTYEIVAYFLYLKNKKQLKS